MEFKLYAILHLFYILITTIPITVTIIFLYFLLKTQHPEEKLKKLVLYYSIFMSFSLLLLKITKELTPNINDYYLSAKNKYVGLLFVVYLSLSLIAIFKKSFENKAKRHKKTNNL